MRLPSLLLLSVGVLVGLTACQPSVTHKTQPSGPAPSLTGSGSAPLLRLVGSNSIGNTLAPALAKAYMEQRLGASRVVVSEDPARHSRRIEGFLPGEAGARHIEVVATGSGFAFTALEQGKADIGMSSRSITAEEIGRLASLGNMSDPNCEHVLGLDGLAVIVNPENPVSRLTVEQLARIFSGSAGNWGEFGGPTLPIHRYARNRESGTFDSFRDMVLGRMGDMASDTHYVVDSRELSAAVAGDRGAVGFVALPFVGQERAVGIASYNQVPIPPTIVNVAREVYPLTRRLYLYTPANPANPAVAEFVEFALSPAGQTIVGRMGFVGQSVEPVVPEKFLGQLPAKVPPSYRQLAQTALVVPVTIHFKPHSTELDNKASRDIGRLAEWLDSSPYRGHAVTLAAFGNSPDGLYAAPNETTAGATAVKAELIRRGVSAVSILDLGEALPLAPDESARAREKNRRVEIWVSR
ncbi:substrate-binding domain-containing protein [Methylolobus aquaticus]